jgi:hypothetical protein
MVDDVLRMRATITTDESLAAMRAWGREIGMLPQKVKPGVNDLNKTFATLSKTIQGMGKDMATIVPSLGAFGLGAGSAAVAAGALLRTFSQMADRIAELREASKELGMSERDIRAWNLAASKVGISAESMQSGLRGFHDAMGALKYNMGPAMDLYARGAAPLASRLKGLKDEAEQLKVAFNFKEILLTGPNGQWVAEQYIKSLGFPAEFVRLSADEAVAAFAKLTPRTKEQQDAAKNLKDSLLELGETWDHLVVRASTPLFPWLTDTIKGIDHLVQSIDDLASGKKVLRLGPLLGGPQGTMPWAAPPLPKAPGLYNFMSMPGAGGGRYDDFINALPFPDATGQIEDRRGDASESQRIIKAGVFDALVDFQSYAQAAAGSAGGGGRFGIGSFAAPGGGLGPGGGGISAGPGGGGGAPGPARTGQGTPAYSGPASAPGGGRTGAAASARGAALYQKLLSGFKGSKLEGVVPPDGPRFGINKGTAEEWARFGTAVAQAESDFNPRDVSDRGRSMGVFQYGHSQAYGNAFDVDNSVKAFVRDATASAGGLRSGILGQRFSTIGAHPERTTRYLDNAARLAGGAGSPTSPGAVKALTGDPSAFIFHHTSGRSTVAGVQETLRQRGLGVEYVMDREGNIVQTGAPGASHMKTGWGAGAGLSNRNTVGMEVIALNDKDVTAAQVKAAREFIAKNYPNTPLFGHGQVNPGHKEADEGMTIVNAIKSDRAARAAAGGRWGTGGRETFNRASPWDVGMLNQPGGEDAFSYRRIDERIGGGQRVDGSVNVAITSNGTAAKARTSTKGNLFQKTQIQSQKQMQPTSEPAGPVLETVP